MSNEHLIIEERSRKIGEFMVGRLLPFRKKRMVGPFVFVDHMGPAEMHPEKPMSVNQHPHIGLATLTYLLEGAVMHADSIGTVQRIEPGEVNLMIAGKGVTHTERTPEDLRDHVYRMEGYQIWLALPKELEDAEPEFRHVPADRIPDWEEEGLHFRLIVGEVMGQQSDLQLWSDAFMLEVSAKEDQMIELGGQLRGEIGVLVNQGAVIVDDERIEAGNLLVATELDFCTLEISAGSRLFLIGGQPYPEKRWIDWNFVSTSKEKIEAAKSDWIQRKFPKVKGDDSYVPYPGTTG